MTMGMILTFYDDELGSVYSTEMVLATVLLVFGVIAGLTSYRDAISQELGDTAVALDSLDQSFSYTITTTTGGGAVVRSFSDATVLTDLANTAPAGLDLETPATAE
jgi:hypothetical protein